MLLLSIVNYLNGVRTVENLLREEVEQGAARIARDLVDALSDRESNLIDLARTHSLCDYVRERNQDSGRARNPVLSIGASASGETSVLPSDVLSDVGAFFRSYQNYYAAITCLDGKGQALFRIERLVPNPKGPEARFQTKNIPLSQVRADARVWSASEMVALRSPVTRESFGASVHYTVPIFPEEEINAPRGALVVDMKLNTLFEEAERDYAAPPSPVTRGTKLDLPSRHITVLDRAGYVIYDTNIAHRYQPVASVMPFLKSLAGKMMTGASGSDFYDDTNGDRWLAAYQPISGLDLSVAVAGNYTNAVKDLQRAGLIGIALSVLTAFIAATLLTWIIRRTTQRIERVTAGAAAIASGDLDQRIEVRANDETRVLAESFNRMSNQLREHIAREAETRQFESFTRLSAMLTHDLKNAIAGLSMLVKNMERQFHREEFRADAIASLQEATDKLRGIVARLSEPVKSLSGEKHLNTRPVDLVPLIKGVLAETAERSAPLYEVETRLPASLVAAVEIERIKSVIENLVINALEAMGVKGGRLTIEAGYTNDHQIFFSIADTGVGMSADFLQKRLFRAFATTKNKGIGLGLYTCREIVQAHGGRLEVESQVGVGACFRVVLPSNEVTTDEGKEQPQDVAVTK